MFDTFELPNIRIGSTKLPTDIYNSVMSEVKEIERYGSPNKWNHELAGAIEKEYRLIESRSFLDPFLIDVSKKYLPNDGGYEVKDMWVNIQSKNEYNPIHRHGGDISFVIWMQIPFKYSDECKVKNVVNSNLSKSASTFQFVYTNILGEVSNIYFPVDGGWEGKMILFPAKLCHTVNPFQTSDGHRISISGNLDAIN
tara:strand:- start:102 stop:692 length:591 start_codon:yes stop_codon:yes gene_type:complete